MAMKERLVQSISWSDGVNLQFVQDDLDLLDCYKEAEKKLAIDTYARIRERRGIWASNQGRFVDDVSELNRWDSRVMENLYAEKEQDEDNGSLQRTRLAEIYTDQPRQLEHANGMVDLSSM